MFSNFITVFFVFDVPHDLLKFYGQPVLWWDDLDIFASPFRQTQQWRHKIGLWKKILGGKGCSGNNDCWRCMQIDPNTSTDIKANMLLCIFIFMYTSFFGGWHESNLWFFAQSCLLPWDFTVKFLQFSTLRVSYLESFLPWEFLTLRVSYLESPKCIWEKPRKNSASMPLLLKSVLRTCNHIENMHLNLVLPQ